MSILEHAKSAEDLALLRTYRMKILMGGPSGSGKTQSITTLPRINGKPILVIDYDDRAQTLAGEPGIQIIRLFDSDPLSPKAWRNGETLRKELWTLARKGEFPYSAVCEDGLSMMGNIAMNDALTLDEKTGLGGAPAKQHYMPQIHALRVHINSMRQLPCHYLLTCHMEPMTDAESDLVKLFPKVTRSLKPELPAWFNETYYCLRKKGKDGATVYLWRTAGTERYDFFKSTLNNKGAYWKDPIVVDFSKKPVGFERLLELRFGVLKDEAPPLEFAPEEELEEEKKEDPKEKGGEKK